MDSADERPPGRGEQRFDAVDERVAGNSFPDSQARRTTLAGTTHTRQLKSTKAFGNVYRRGRWARGTRVSVGAISNATAETRIGLRTRRGMKRAVDRNRSKRQIRAIIRSPGFLVKAGLDIVVVIHPTDPPASSSQLESDLRLLCRRLGAA